MLVSELEKKAEHRIKKTNAMVSQLIGIASKAHLPLDHCTKVNSVEKRLI
tara:strand:+ start:1217 stop:1366 length:150 start_codon:yes stop_codon:yes gene_type:complete